MSAAKADRESAMRAAVEREPVWTKQAGETAWKRFLARHGFKPTLLMVRVHEEAFNEAVASEVAAAKAKPHAETAEEVVRQLEWIRANPSKKPCEPLSCPHCGRDASGTHASDCHLAAVLRENP